MAVFVGTGRIIGGSPLTKMETSEIISDKQEYIYYSAGAEGCNPVKKNIKHAI